MNRSGTNILGVVLYGGMLLAVVFAVLLIVAFEWKPSETGFFWGVAAVTWLVRLWVLRKTRQPGDWREQD